KPGARATYLDAKTIGLQIRVTPNGVKTFSVFRRVKGGSPERVTLGRYPALSVEQARRQAAEINAAIENRQNPADIKRAHKAELTFSDLVQEYLERHSKPLKRTWAEDVSKYEQYLQKPLGAKKLSAITRRDIADIHSRVSK